MQARGRRVKKFLFDTRSSESLVNFERMSLVNAWIVRQVVLRLAVAVVGRLAVVVGRWREVEGGG